MRRWPRGNTLGRLRSKRSKDGAPEQHFVQQRHGVIETGCITAACALVLLAFTANLETMQNLSNVSQFLTGFFVEWEIERGSG